MTKIIATLDYFGHKCQYSSAGQTRRSVISSTESPKSTRRRPGRPAEFDREKAIRAAVDLFWQRGYPAVTARDLAEAMSIQRSSFYNSFGSREAVFREALERYAAEAPDAALNDPDPEEPAADLLTRVLREACRVRAADSRRRGCMVCNGLAQLVGSDDELGQLLEAAVQQRISGVEKLLEAGIESGTVSPAVAPTVAARSYVAFLIGLNTLSKVVRSEEQLWRMCRSFLDGLGLDTAPAG